MDRGKDPASFASTLAALAVRNVRSGRGLRGQEASQDALSPLARRRRGFTVRPLPPSGHDRDDLALEALQDNAVTPPPDQAAFRIDYPRWLARLGRRRREMAEGMALSLTTGELAARHGLSAGRVSQVRRELHRDWRRFHGEEG